MTKYYIGVAEIEVDSSRIRLDELKKESQLTEVQRLSFTDQSRTCVKA